MSKFRSKSEAEITLLTPRHNFRGHSFQFNVEPKNHQASEQQTSQENKKEKNSRKFLKVYTAEVGIPTPSSISLAENSEQFLIENLKLHLEKYVATEKRQQERTFSGIETPIEKITNVFKDLN